MDVRGIRIEGIRVAKVVLLQGGEGIEGERRGGEQVQ
jgi:hypothetical protein